MSFVLAFISSFSWAVFDLSRKKLVGHFSKVSLLLFLSVTQALFFSFILLFRGEGLAFPKQHFLTFLGGLVCVFIGNLAFLKSIQLSQFSSVIPLLSFIPVFSMMFSGFILGEWLSFQQVCGALVIVVSSFFIQSSGDNKFQLEKGVWYMLLASLCWALTSIADKLVLTEISKFVYSFEQNLAMACILAGYLLLKSPKQLMIKWTRPKLFFLILGSTASMFAIFFQFWSIEVLYVGVFEAFKRAISLFLTLLFARLFFKEIISAKKIIFIVVMIFGVFLMSI